MKKLATLLLALLMISALCVSAAAAGITADTATKGNWIGKYGSDGYYLFSNTAESCVDNLPDYVSEFTFTTIFGDPVSYHAWWNGTPDDAASLPAPHTMDDAIWRDEAMTEKAIPCIYNGDGLSVTIDVGAVESTVSLLSIDGGDDGRCVEVNLYDADGNALCDAYDLTDFAHGTYLTATITGKVTFEYAYYDATKLGSPSNAVIAAVYFDGVYPAAEEATEEPEAVEEPAAEEAAEEPAVEEVVEEPAAEEVVVEEPEAVEEPAVEEAVEEVVVEEPEVVEEAAPVVEAAPQTFDAVLIAAVAAIVSAAGYAVSRKH